METKKAKKGIRDAQYRKETILFDSVIFLEVCSRFVCPYNGSLK